MNETKNNQSLPDPLIDSKREKIILEVQQLELGIKDQKLSWFKKPAYLSVFVPIVIALIALCAGILSGWFNAERLRLETERSKLLEEKEKILNEVTQYQSVLDSFKIENEKIMQENTIQSYVLNFDIEEVPKWVLDDLPTEKENNLLSKEEIKKIAKKFRLMEFNTKGQINWDDGNISYWYEQELPAWKITIQFLAHSLVLDKANKENIKIPAVGVWSSWAKPIYSILLVILEERHSSNLNPNI